MPILSPSLPQRICSGLAASAAAPLGLPLTNPFCRPHASHAATLTIDANASVPRGVLVLRPGSRHDAIVRIGALPLRAGGQVPTLAIRITDAYGPSRPQDFLLASSGNGAPAHHLLRPSRRAGDKLFSSLWLYRAGRKLVMLGVLPFDAVAGDGAVLPFAISGPVGRFRRIGSLTLGHALTDEAPSGDGFAAVNDGDGLTALPPTRLYRQRP